MVILWEKLPETVVLASAVKNYRLTNLLSFKQGLLVIRSHGREWACQGRGERQGQGWQEWQGHKSKTDILCSEDLLVGGIGGR